MSSNMNNAHEVARSVREDYAFFHKNEILHTGVDMFLTMVSAESQESPETVVKVINALMVNGDYFLHASGLCRLCMDHTQDCDDSRDGGHVPDDFLDDEDDWKEFL